MIQRTLSIIKPDAVARSLQGEILAMIQRAGLRIVAMKMIRLTKAQAEAFYAVHKARPFYGELVSYMASGPVVCSVLEGEDAVANYRTLMGATDPAKAAEGTIRRLYAQSLDANAVHGSDAPETAAQEIAFFFSQTEIVG
jgi:nucleoside-diphosphate kinase